MAVVSEHSRIGLAVGTPHDPCYDADLIGLLDRLDAGGVTYGCNYVLDAASRG